MTPVIQARPGGLFAAWWRPAPRGLVYPSPRAWFDVQATPHSKKDLIHVERSG